MDPQSLKLEKLEKEVAALKQQVESLEDLRGQVDFLRSLCLDSFAKEDLQLPPAEEEPQPELVDIAQPMHENGPEPEEMAEAMEVAIQKNSPDKL